MKKIVNAEKGKVIFKNLENEILKKHPSMEEFSAFLQFDREEFYKKMVGIDEFELSEIISICKYFNESADYLFEEALNNGK